MAKVKLPPKGKWSVEGFEDKQTQECALCSNKRAITYTITRRRKTVIE